MQQRPRAAAIIVNGDEIALIKREHSKRGKLYYLFPGGGLEHGETYEEAVVREVLEETGLEVAVDRLVAIVLRLGNPQFHFLVHIQAGEFGSGTGAEMVGEYESSRGTYEAVWMPVDDLATRPVYPRCVCDLVKGSLTDGWPETPANYVDDE